MVLVVSLTSVGKRKCYRMDSDDNFMTESPGKTRNYRRLSRYIKAEYVI